MNRISPKVLLNSKWTKLAVSNKEKHFIITDVEFCEDQRVIRCVIQALINNNEYEIDWHELKQTEHWAQGWK